MRKRNIILIAALGVISIVGIYFGLRKFQQAKKSVSISSVLATGSEQRAANDSQDTVVKIQETNNIQDASNNVQDTTAHGLQPKDKGSNTNTNTNTNTAAINNSQVAPAGSNNADLGKIVSKLVAWGFQKSSGRKIDTIILHSSYDALGSDPFSVAGVIAEYKQAQVSPHYLITRDGTIYQLVADQNIAWHAGVAKMPDGRTDVNSFSIGIEMINTQTGKFTDQQYSAVNRLIGDLKNKYPIKNILGHNDIAPGRKTDPWGIEWKKIQK